jgi:threonine dehydratase
VLLGMEPSPGTDLQTLLVPALRQTGCTLTDFSANELVKMHVSHMVGGRARDVAQELAFEVEMPERPGILRHFLNALGDQWNITIFHYRKQGGAYARVFIGFDVGNGGAGEIRARLKAMKFRFTEETRNSAYRLFLR